MNESANPSGEITPEFLAQLNAKVTQDLPKFMDHLFGKGRWFFDERESLYIAANPKHSGPGFGFVAVRTDGTWFTGVRPSMIQGLPSED